MIWKYITEAPNTLRSFGKTRLRRKARGSFLVTYAPPTATLEERFHLYGGKKWENILTIYVGFKFRFW